MFFMLCDLILHFLHLRVTFLLLFFKLIDLVGQCLNLTGHLPHFLLSLVRLCLQVHFELLVFFPVFLESLHAFIKLFLFHNDVLVE